MRRFTAWTIVTGGLALLHTLPARHHLADFATKLDAGDAWKGLGAAVAVIVLALPFERQARLVAKAEARGLAYAFAFALAVAHLVPATDHLPKLFAHPSFGDAWRGLLSTLAVAWFSTPRSTQLSLVRFGVRRRRPSPI